MFNSQTIDRLMLGINSIVSENRSSLSDKEINLLTESLSLLEAVKNSELCDKDMATWLVSSVIEVLLRILLVDDFCMLKDIIS
jgi:hypothetical protein